jgi:CheY-like chemotaxis protein
MAQTPGCLCPACSRVHSKAEGYAWHRWWRWCATADALADEVGARVPKLIVVDLNARSNPLGAIERVRASGPEIPLIGFLSHVQVDLVAQARAAGCADVMPRSKFTQNLATILARAKSES